jgi:hypothetical protein
LKLIENSGGIDNLESEYQHNLEWIEKAKKCLKKFKE